MLAGIECDILADGSMDLADDCLAALDIVVASIHSAMAQDEREMTARVIKAIEHPSVDIIGHLTARMLLRRDGTKVNVEKVIDAAKANGVALEINSQPHRLDLCDSHARLARDRGVKLVIDSDAHDDRGARLPALGRADGPPGVAHQGRRHQHAAAEGVHGGAATTPVAIGEAAAETRQAL